MKKLVISTSKSKKESIETLERALEGKSDDPDYRFTAVLPESVGQRLRIHCARHRLKLKDIFAEAVMDFLDRRKIEVAARD